MNVPPPGLTFWLAGDLPGYHQVSEHPIFHVLITVGHLAWNTTWFLFSAMMVMISSDTCYLLTQLPERIVTPVKALLFQAKEALQKHKTRTPL